MEYETKVICALFLKDQIIDIINAMNKLIFIFFYFFFSITIHAQERASAFIITAHGDYYKVLGPSELVGLSNITKERTVAVIIENKTLSKLVGKIESGKKDQVEFVTIEAGDSKSIDLMLKKDHKYYFYPLSPAFQRVELMIGKKAYEIPAKR